jgi:hypothetical protein
MSIYLFKFFSKIYSLFFKEKYEILFIKYK